MSSKTKKDDRKHGSGKRLQRYENLLQDLEQQRRGIKPPLDNAIHLWYNKEVNRWRWTLVGNIDDRMMESGDAEDLDKALTDIKRTIEWVMETQDE